MLLLIVGDGIREGVETLADYLQGHAGFHFTLGLIELALHRVPGAASFIVQPRVLARTINIERAIVRIEGGNPVVSALPAAGATGGGRRTSITEERFFEGLAEFDPTAPERLRKFLDRLANLGVMYEFGVGSLILKWTDSRGDKFQLGRIYHEGNVWLDGRRLTSVRLDLAHDYLERLAARLQGTLRRSAHPTGWYVTTDGASPPTIDQMLEISDGWLEAIEHYTAELEQAAQAKEVASGN